MKARIAKLREAGIKPTLMRIIFLQKALGSNLNTQLISDRPDVNDTGVVVVPQQQQQQQQQQPVETTEDIVQRLVSILARAEIVPVEKRLQFAQALYDTGISDEQTLRDNVLGDKPDVDLADIGMMPPQKKKLLKFLAALQPSP